MKAKTARIKDKSSFKSFFYLTLLQFLDKMKFSIKRPDGKVDVKTIIQKIVFAVLRFVLIAGVVGGLFYLIKALNIYPAFEFVNIYIVFYFAIIVMTLISNTVTLMKDLYYSDDNKFLVTTPVSSSQLFFSKIIVFLITDFKKSLDILIPVTFGFVIAEVILKQMTIPAVFWFMIPLLMANVLYVILAAFFSVVALYIYKLLKTYPIFELITVIILAIAGIALVIFLISRIPEDINLIEQWQFIKRDIQDKVNSFSMIVYPFKIVVEMMFGIRNTQSFYELHYLNFVFFAAMILIILVLGAIAYFSLKPFYLRMVTKTFEFDKNLIDVAKQNKKHKRFITFTNKEFKLTFRDTEISGSYLIVYIAAPLLLYFMDTVFKAINTDLEGNVMTYAINILLIILPYLAANSMVATMFSKEGRAAYMKKTKPINIFLPITSKLLFNMIFCIPSIIACAVVFGTFANIGVFPPIAVAISVILIQYGHIFFSATRDIMNPQNEIYATNGELSSNPNERVSTVVAFVLSFAVAGVSWFFLNESITQYETFTYAFIRLIAISALIFGAFTLLYILNIKAYYYEK